MIKALTNKRVWQSKTNWIDQNNIVVGYDSCQQCCEIFGWGVYNLETREKVSDDPDGLPYHFGEECDYETFEPDADRDSCVDIDQIELLPDDGRSPVLVLEFFNCHNGYYAHDFSVGKMKEGSDDVR